MHNPAYVKVRKELIMLVHNIIVLKPAELKEKLISLVKIVESIPAEVVVEKQPEIKVETRSVQEVAKEAEEIEKNKKKKSKKGQDE